MQNKKYNLLFINEDKTNLSSFEKDFHRGFNIITAKSTIDGLGILTKDDIHLVILDCQLPETSGLKFLKEVKNKYPDLKCILLTDHDGIKMFRGSFDSINLWRYIIKPYEVTELTAVIKNALENYQLKIDNNKLIGQLEFRSERYEKMMDTAMDSIIIINDKHEITEANNAACELFGYNPKELIGSPLSILIPENKRKTYPKLVRSFSNSEQTNMMMGHDTHRHGLTSNGKKVPIEISLSKQITKEGNFYNAFIRDVSERLKREQRIKESESKLIEAQRIAKLGHWEYDIGTKNYYWSDEMYRILGMAPKAVEESSKVFYDRVYPDDRESTRKSYYESVEVKQPLDIKYRLKLPDGQIKHVHEKCVTHYDDQGKAFRSIGTFQDVTVQIESEIALKKHEERLVEKATELEDSLEILEGKNHELEQFAFIASHDLQEPLSTVSSFVELLNQEYRGKLDDDAHTYLRFILESTQRMRNLIHGLLEYSRLGKGRSIERVDCNEILKSVLEDLQGVISEKQGKIKRDPLPTLNGHPVELRQLFANLIGNALKYCKEGVTPVINISSRKQNGIWEFKFKDNGIGIDEKFHEKIFIIFQRLHNNQDYEGTGIGLAHCRKIVELHNGRIWVESIPDKGSEFYFTIKM